MGTGHRRSIHVAISAARQGRVYTHSRGCDLHVRAPVAEVGQSVVFTPVSASGASRPPWFPVIIRQRGDGDDIGPIGRTHSCRVKAVVARRDGVDNSFVHRRCDRFFFWRRRPEATEAHVRHLDFGGMRRNPVDSRDDPRLETTTFAVQNFDAPNSCSWSNTYDSDAVVDRSDRSCNMGPVAGAVATGIVGTGNHWVFFFRFFLFVRRNAVGPRHHIEVRVRVVNARVDHRDIDVYSNIVYPVDIEVGVAGCVDTFNPLWHGLCKGLDLVVGHNIGHLGVVSQSVEIRGRQTCHRVSLECRAIHEAQISILPLDLGRRH